MVMRTRASNSTSLTARSSKEKNPSFHDISSKMTFSIAWLKCRSSSFCVIARVITRRSPSVSDASLEAASAARTSASPIFPA